MFDKVDPCAEAQEGIPLSREAERSTRDGPVRKDGDRRGGGGVIRRRKRGRRRGEVITVRGDEGEVGEIEMGVED